MQYIKKHNTPPSDWDAWFTTATNVRSYNYRLDQDALTQLKFAKQHLIDAQDGLCAYCQKRIDMETASIEHVLPKEFNVEGSTNYTNLVAVCKIPLIDPIDKRDHCDKVKGNMVITPLIFLSNCEVTETINHAYFDVDVDGSILAKPRLSSNHKGQVEAFIDTLNLNHSLLKQIRANYVLACYVRASRQLKGPQQRQYWKAQFDIVFKDKRQPYRQFLLIFMAKKLGIN